MVDFSLDFAAMFCLDFGRNSTPTLSGGVVGRGGTDPPYCSKTHQKHRRRIGIRPEFFSWHRMMSLDTQEHFWAGLAGANIKKNQSIIKKPVVISSVAEAGSS